MNEKTITKRIREVWPADQVAHLWANRSQDHARTPGAANFYFHGPVIFSYRDSYAIATFTPWRDADTGRALVIMRETPASMTTGRHFGRVFGALRGHPVRVIEVDPVYRGAVAEVPELARFADGFTDLARHEGRLIADGHARTGLSIAAVLIWHARKRAAEALERRAPHTIASCYWRAAGKVADARAVVAAVVAAAPAKDRAKLRKDGRLILSAAPELPAGFVNAEAGERARGIAPAWNDPERDAWENAGAVARALAGDAPTEAAVTLWRAQTAAARDAKREAELSRHLDRAKQREVNARAATAPDVARREWTEAGAEWTRAAFIAKRQKRGADTVARYRTAAAAADKRAARFADAATVAEARGVLRVLNNTREGLARRMGEGARTGRKSGRDFWNRDNMPRAGSIRAAIMPVRWKDARTHAGNVAEYAAAVTRILDGGAPFAHGMDGRYAEKKTAALVRLAASPAKLAPEAARLVSELRAAAVALSADVAAAQRRIVGREVSGAVATLARAIHQSESETLTLGNASHVARQLSMNARDYSTLLNGQRADVAHAVAAALGLPSLGTLQAQARDAEMLAVVAADVGNVSGLAQGVAAARDSLRTVSELIAGNMYFDAERRAVAAVSAAETLHGRALTAIEAARNADSHSWSDGIKAAVNEAAQRAAANLADLAAVLAELRNVADAAEKAASEARHDRLAHWRATGEGERELNNAVGYGVAFFRKDRAGAIRSNMGAVVPESAGRRLWALIRASVAAGLEKTWPYGEGPRVGSFRLERITADGAAKVGCHTISAREAREFAQYMGWPPFGAETAADAVADDTGEVAA